MSEMNRVTAGHGSGGNPFDWIGKKVAGRTSALQQGIQHAASQQADHEHEIRKMVTQHVLAKDMHTHISKDAHSETPVTMTYGNIQTGNVKRARKSRMAQPPAAETTTPSEHVETPASTPQAAEAESAPREEHHKTFVGATIPTTPGEWSGGYLEHNPKTGKAQTKPGYKEFKTRKQHFESGLASQQGHFAVKPEIKIPNYARKAMQPKKGK
jgi:hypothetical protein